MREQPLTHKPLSDFPFYLSKAFTLNCGPHASVWQQEHCQFWSALCSHTSESYDGVVWSRPGNALGLETTDEFPRVSVTDDVAGDTPLSTCLMIRAGEPSVCSCVPGGNSGVLCILWLAVSLAPWRSGTLIRKRTSRSAQDGDRIYCTVAPGEREPAVVHPAWRYEFSSIHQKTASQTCL